MTSRWETTLKNELDWWQKKYSIPEFGTLYERVISNDERAPLEIISTMNKINEVSEQRKQQLLITLYSYIGFTAVEREYVSLKEASQTVPLNELLNQLNGLVGLQDVKAQINRLIAFKKVQQMRQANGLATDNGTKHMAFLGNPGTAKTTVARIVGRMYKSLGLLSKGHFIEASRTDLIAEYQGQTATKARKLIERAKGGVLFIDEAYSLTENTSSDSYGRESLTELTKALEDYRDDLVVIVAGYPDLMKDFFRSNPGLKSRFNTFITFPNYTVDELLQIFQLQLDNNDYKVDDGTLSYLKEEISKQLTKDSEKTFANGRYIRNVFESGVLAQSQRLFESVDEASVNDLMTLTTDDIREAVKKQFEIV